MTGKAEKEENAVRPAELCERPGGMSGGVVQKDDNLLPGLGAADGGSDSCASKGSEDIGVKSLANELDSQDTVARKRAHNFEPFVTHATGRAVAFSSGSPLPLLEVRRAHCGLVQRDEVIALVLVGKAKEELGKGSAVARRQRATETRCVANRPVAEAAVVGSLPKGREGERVVGRCEGQGVEVVGAHCAAEKRLVSAPRLEKGVEKAALEHPLNEAAAEVDEALALGPAHFGPEVAHPGFREAEAAGDGTQGEPFADSQHGDLGSAGEALEELRDGSRRKVAAESFAFGRDMASPAIEQLELGSAKAAQRLQVTRFAGFGDTGDRFLGKLPFLHGKAGEDVGEQVQVAATAHDELVGLDEQAPILGTNGDWRPRFNGLAFKGRPGSDKGGLHVREDDAANEHGRRRAHERLL